MIEVISEKEYTKFQKQCKYVILELKYTESINQIAIFQSLDSYSFSV